MVSSPVYIPEDEVKNHDLEAETGDVCLGGESVCRE